MSAALLPTDVWTVLLAVGIVVSFVCTVAMIVGLAPAKKQRERPAPPVPALPMRSAGAVRERAAARARAAAASAPTAGHVLTDVRVVPTAAPPAAPPPPPRGADGGQPPRATDDPGPERAVTPEQAEAIVAHFAEHQPERIAEVITQWIRADEKPWERDRR